MDHSEEPSGENRRRTIRNIDQRRAVLRILLRSDRPMTVPEIVRAVERVDDVDLGGYRTGGATKRVANLLAWQVRQRRVRRVGRGLFEAVPGAFARTTRWRIDNWERVAERR